MRTISLKEFALTGEFGPVKVGMTKAEVIDLLGRPDNDVNFGGDSSGLTYSWYEFFFYKKTGKLIAIQNDHLMAAGSWHKRSIHFKNDHFQIDTWFIKANRNVTLGGVKAILQQEGIPFLQELFIESQILRLQSGVYLDFDRLDSSDEAEVEQDNQAEREDEALVLNGIRYFPRF